MQDARTRVVKLGGSLAASPELEGWLARISACGGGRVVVVPGGGPFADQVRTLQALRHFDNETAHAMALHAMDQYGLMLCGLQSGLVPVSTLADLDGALAIGKVPVWLPAAMLIGNPVLPASWDITSDSIAAWLAREIGACHLLLVKYRSRPAGDVDLDRMEKDGTVDRGFRQFISNAGFGWSISGKADYAGFAIEI